jgi:hypothetical protein
MKRWMEGWMKKGRDGAILSGNSATTGKRVGRALLQAQVLAFFLRADRIARNPRSLTRASAARKSDGAKLPISL